MTQNIRINNLAKFNMAGHLDSDEAIVEYLNQVLDEDDSAELAQAIGVIACARGMTREA